MEKINIVSKDFDVKVVTIDPIQAKDWLDNHNHHNRPKKKHSISVYTDDMLNNNWIFNGDPIRFDKSGELIDGQNRLQACVNSKTPLRAVIEVGLDPEAMKTIDTGVSRKFSDFLKIDGIKYSTNIAAAVSKVLGRLNGIPSKSMKLSILVGYEEFEKYQTEYKNASRFAFNVYNKCGKILSTSIITAACVYLKTRLRKSDEDIAEFFDIFTGDIIPSSGKGNEYQEMPRVLYKKLLRRFEGYHKCDSDEMMYYLIKSWNYYVDRKYVSNITYEYSPDSYKSIFK